MSQFWKDCYFYKDPPGNTVGWHGFMSQGTITDLCVMSKSSYSEILSEIDRLKGELEALKLTMCGVPAEMLKIKAETA